MPSQWPSKNTQTTAKISNCRAVPNPMVASQSRGRPWDSKTWSVVSISSTCDEQENDRSMSWIRSDPISIISLKYFDYFYLNKLWTSSGGFDKTFLTLIFLKEIVQSFLIRPKTDQLMLILTIIHQSSKWSNLDPKLITQKKNFLSNYVQSYFCFSVFVQKFNLNYCIFLGLGSTSCFFLYFSYKDLKSFNYFEFQKVAHLEGVTHLVDRLLPASHSGSGLITDRTARECRLFSARLAKHQQSVQGGRRSGGVRVKDADGVPDCGNAQNIYQ